jgi:pyrroline-5-carboxylate reductase
LTSPPSPAADAADFLSGKTVGIIGCGHLGRTLALELLGSGLPGDGLLVSYGGNASTLEKIREAGLQERISSNEDICALSDIVFISVRPQSIGDLGRISFRKGAVVVSCAAGVSTSSLKSIFGVDAFRVMPSGPDTIRQRKGIAAVYPKSDLLSGLLFCLGLKAYQLEDEDLMHLFTTGVCLPAALLAAEDMELEIEGAVETIAVNTSNSGRSTPGQERPAGLQLFSRQRRLLQEDVHQRRNHRGHSSEPGPEKHVS